MGAALSLLVYDNSPTSAPMPAGLAFPAVYRHDVSNSGLAVAYNAALEAARAQGAEWLLLLDQDTDLTEAYFRALLPALAAASEGGRIGALVPRVEACGRIVSPGHLGCGLLTFKPFPLDAARSMAIGLTAINSGAVLRISALDEIGGFNEDFWLDYLDHWLFNELGRAGYLVNVLQVTLRHGFAMYEREALPMWRYENVLAAERQFFWNHTQFRNRVCYVLRMLIYVTVLLLAPRRRRFFRSALRHLISSLATIFTKAEPSRPRPAT